MEADTIGYRAGNFAIGACGEGKEWQLALALLSGMNPTAFPKKSYALDPTGPTLSTLTRTPKKSYALDPTAFPKKSYALDPTAFVTPLRTLTLARLWESLLPYSLDPRGRLHNRG